MPLSDVEAVQFSRHILLPEVGGTGQEALRRARVSVRGSGLARQLADAYVAAGGSQATGVDWTANVHVGTRVVACSMDACEACFGAACGETEVSGAQAVAAGAFGALLAQELSLRLLSGVVAYDVSASGQVSARALPPCEHRR